MIYLKAAHKERKEFCTGFPAFLDFICFIKQKQGKQNLVFDKISKQQNTKKIVTKPRNCRERADKLIKS